MSYIEVYNISDFEDEMIYAYNKIIINNFLIGGVLLITTLANMSLIYGVRKHIDNLNLQIKNNLLPPSYK